MVSFTLPDGKVLSFDSEEVTPYQAALSIGAGLAKDAVLAKVDGQLWDLHRPVVGDCKEFQILTSKNEETLPVLRHHCAHLLAQSVKSLFPDIQLTIGPPIKDGFYYDFAVKKPFTPDDFQALEEKMHQLVDADIKVDRQVCSRDTAIDMLNESKESYKIRLLERIPEDETLTVYHQADWFDLCRGPHLPSTKHVGHAFKLLKVSASYWEGDSKNEPLQRIYGTCWWNEKDLNNYLSFLDEVKKRDHRKLGPEMKLFHFQEEAPGMPFWHERGWNLYRQVEDYIRRKLSLSGYREVNTPQLVHRDLWEKSGHWDKFGENIYVAKSGDDRDFIVKPMNCPCHVQIFNKEIRSYKNLPMRMAEFGCCHRSEPSGALHGLMRVRKFVQDDAHIFCTEDQIVEETKRFCDLLGDVYKDFGFTNYKVLFSDRPEKRAGSEATWDLAEASLQDAVKKAGLDFQLNKGEGAFYGPKLEFVLTDAIGRDWQCGTLQLDFILPERLDANYIDQNNEKKRPVLMHRAILGSIERFIGILIEETSGDLPLWLSPSGIIVCSLTDDCGEYAGEVTDAIANSGVKVDSDLRSISLQQKIRDHSGTKVPILCIIGDNEVKNRTVSFRFLNGKMENGLSLNDACERLIELFSPPA